MGIFDLNIKNGGFLRFFSFISIFLNIKIKYCHRDGFLFNNFLYVIPKPLYYMFYCHRETYKDFTTLWSVSCFVLLLLPIITYKKINNRLIKMDIKTYIQVSK